MTNLKFISKALPITVILGLFLFSLLTILPFFRSGFFIIHDDTQVQRVFEMKRALSDGMFPVRWVPDLGYGYGYPIFNFYGPFPYYVGGFFNLIGMDALLATKIMIAGAVFGSSFSMYFLGREFWGRRGGLLSAVLYLFAPYHALNTYVRGDAGELYAYFFIPLIFYGILRYYKTKNFSFVAVGSLSYAGLISSHNLSALMISPFIFITVLILFAASKKNFLLFAIPVLGILISAFYSVPAFLEMNYTNVVSTIGGKADFRDHFVCLPQLWDSPWMYGGSIPGCIDGLSFRLGKLHIVLGLLGVLGGLFLLRKEREKMWVILLSLLGLIVSVFLMLLYSKPIWEIIPYMNFFQYPWRFLLPASFFSSLIGGAVFYYLSILLKASRMPLLMFFLILILTPVIFYSRLFKPQEIVDKTSSDYTNEQFLNWETSKISDEYMPERFDTPRNKNEIIKNKIEGDVQITNLKSNTKELTSDLSTQSQTEITVHIPYFPAWNYYLNGQKIPVREVISGVSFEIPSGKSRLLAKFVETPIEALSNLISISSVLALAAVIIYAKRKIS